MRVEIWSDLVCPWCYIGSTNLRTAVERHHGDVEVVYRSFLLDPTAPDEPTLAVDYLAARYGGGREQALEMMRQVSAVAAGVGLEYHLEDSLAGQTRDAHRVLHLAAEHGVQADVVARYFAAHFTQNRSLFDHGSLADLAAEAGLDRAATAQALAEGTYADAVAADIAQAHAYGITGVPFFVVDGAYGVSGAQPPEVLGSVLERAAADAG